jgi:hypothetical protein
MKKVLTLDKISFASALFEQVQHSIRLALSLFLAVTTLGLVSCNSNDDESSGIVIDGIDLTSDVDCCSAEEALQVYRFLQTVKIVPELSTVVDEKYNVFAYTKTGTLHKGYNDLYFVVTKKSTGNYVKNFDLTNVAPTMDMVKMPKSRITTPLNRTAFPPTMNRAMVK